MINNDIKIPKKKKEMNTFSDGISTTLYRSSCILILL